MLNRLLLAVSLLIPFTIASPTIKRRASELNKSYDFVIVGGGTAGLTVADRLSAAFSNFTVLVIEIGGDYPRAPYFEPPNNSSFNAPRNYFEYTDPIPTLNNRSSKPFLVGKTIGGSSAANGQFYDRASRHDYDQWSNYSEASEWNWEGLQPFFQKSVTFIEPSQEDVDNYGYTWDSDSAYGGSTPINVSFPPFQWDTAALSRLAWSEIGLEPKLECAAGDKAGLCWMAQTQNPWDASRSHSGIGHYKAVQPRSNYHILTYAKVNRVIYSGTNLANQVPVVEFKSLNSSSVYNITARAEVIISAGAVHTPQILQRSGIGPPQLLQKAGIPVVLEIPGVGYNFQDHCAASLTLNVTHDILPDNDALSNNETYFKEAISQYALRPAQGPYTLGIANTAGFVPLSNVTSNYKALAQAVRAQISAAAATQYLPAGTPDTVVAGYYHQLSHIADLMENPDQPIVEGWTLDIPKQFTLLHPLSRGSILLNPSNIDGEPIVNFNTASNPLDLDILITFIPFFRKLYATDALKELGIVETSPGANVTTPAALKKWLVNSALQQTDYHPCCTAHMAPMDKGGVVGPHLRVHGLHRLRVADLSVVPMELGTHTQATAYAIGEKAADLIIKDWDLSN